MNIIGYIGIAVIILMFLFILFVIYYISKGTKTFISNIEGTSWKELIEAVIEVIEKKFKEKEVTDIPHPSESKRKEIMRNSLKSFYYLDEGQIQYLLPQIDNETLKLTKVETNKSDSKNLSAKTPNAVLELNTGQTSSNQMKETYEVKETGVVKMYQSIENHFFTGDEIKFGLEDIMEESIEYGISLFKEKCQELREFNYDISEEEQEAHIRKSIGKNAELMVQNISKTTGYIALQIDTELTEKNNEMYELTYNHPINKYLYDNTKKPLQFKLLCIKSNITQNGIATLRKDRRFNITAIGKITGWDEENRVLEITPIAIY